MSFHSWSLWPFTCRIHSCPRLASHVSFHSSCATSTMARFFLLLPFQTPELTRAAYLLSCRRQPVGRPPLRARPPEGVDVAWICDSGHRAGGHGEWRPSWGVRPRMRPGLGANDGARAGAAAPSRRALCARGGWKDSARCALRRRKYCRCNGGDSGRRHAWRRLERRGIRSQRRARVRLNTLLDEEV